MHQLSFFCLLNILFEAQCKKMKKINESFNSNVEVNSKVRMICEVMRVVDAETIRADIAGRQTTGR